MATSLKDFKKELYQEYLEEVAFLYEQRQTLLDDTELSWLDLDDYDQRIEAHLDGLVVGGDLALETCAEQAEEGDAGELHAALRVFCRQEQFDKIKPILLELDYGDMEVVQAAADALKWELPDSWKDDTLELLNEAPACAPLIAILAGFRRWSSEAPRLHQVLPEQSTGVAQTLWALGRLPDPKSTTLLLDRLDNEDPDVCSAARLALLRLGDKSVLNKVLENSEPEDWPFLLLGLGGDQNQVKALNSVVATGQANPDCLLALGLLGELASFDTLVNQLENQDLAPSAAMALNLITGAKLYEEAFIPDKIDEDELLEEELEKLKKGENLYLPDQQPGINLTRITQDPNTWKQWYAANQARFQPGLRYRNGKPYSPATLVDNLSSETCPGPIRRLVGEELAIRYGVDLSFEVDHPIAQQKQIITKYKEWARSKGSRFQAGKY
jgi:uncharacterized protein (TIGR02270 family)